MEFSEAKEVRMPFGKYIGKTLDDIAITDEGLKYIDWLSDQDWLRGSIKEAVAVYVKDATIAKDIAEFTEGE
jgi:uncharacterized protein (DUF3820 family)